MVNPPAQYLLSIQTSWSFGEKEAWETIYDNNWGESFMERFELHQPSLKSHYLQQTRRISRITRGETSAGVKNQAVSPALLFLYINGCCNVSLRILKFIVEKFWYPARISQSAQNHPNLVYPGNIWCFPLMPFSGISCGKNHNPAPLQSLGDNKYLMTPYLETINKFESLLDSRRKM